MAEVTGSNPVSPTTYLAPYPMLRARPTLAAILFLSAVSSANAISDEAWRQQAEAIVSGLTYQEGTVRLLGSNASVEVPWNYGYLDARSAERILVDIWGNPPGSGVLGLLVPQGTDFLSSRAWAVVLQYWPDGYVRVDSFAPSAAAALLAEMQRLTRVSSLERERLGYPGLELVGWAVAPSLSDNRDILLWAKEIENPSDGARTLIYNARLLGRQGVLALTAIAPIERFQEVEEGMQSVLQGIEFVSGYQYADVAEGDDQAAPYDWVGLVTEQLEQPSNDASAWLLWGFGGLLFLVVFAVVVRRFSKSA